MPPASPFSVHLTPRAIRALKKLKRDRKLLAALDEAIRSLATDPRPRGTRKLVSKRFDNLYRIRVGDWRILYAVEDDRLVVLVLDVVRRDHAYRAI